jgi:hypothetical protein
MTLKIGSKSIAVYGSVVGLIAIFSILVSAGPLLADDFRIETQIYLGADQTPVSQNLTLFSNGMVYDFEMSNDAKPKPLEIVIYNSHDRSFVLLDIERGMRLQLDQSQVVQMVEGLRQQTSQSELTKFLVEDNFVEDVDISSRSVSLKNPHIEYWYRGSNLQDATVLPAYFEFLDQYTRLNASDPTKLPPFPRLKLNQSIKKYGWIPSEVKVTLNPNELIKSKIEIKSKHTLVLSLSDSDRARIKEAKSTWMSSKGVDLATYRGLKKPFRIADAKRAKPANKGSEDSAKHK